ncbi:MAG: hypothetical protein IT226_17055 [Flavobacteriales bacterium]|nr:hypothetical protein [Flavobacteriales bacterium]
MSVVIKKKSPAKRMKSLLKKARPKKTEGFDAKRFNGALKLKGDPVKVQRKLRDEWA